MPKFVIVAKDKPNALELRMATRPTHLEYMATIAGDILVGGPLLGEDGNPNGSLIVAEFEDLAAAKTFAAGDPYAAAGLFETVTIQAWRQVTF